MEDSSKKEFKHKKALSGVKAVALSICVIVLVILVSCILVLRLMPDSIGAYFIADFFESIGG